MRRSHGLLACAVLVLCAAPAAAATLTGTVIGEGARAVAGATVEVVGAAPPCRTTSAADGTFALACAAVGRHTVRASRDALRPWEIADLDLAPDHSLHLNFMLLPAAAPGPGDGDAAGVPAVAAADAGAGFWTRPLPNPVLATVSGRTITLRAAAVVTGAVAFVLGGLTVVLLGRRFGVRTRRLAPDEVGDLVLNPIVPAVGERVTPVATVGARGAEATTSYGADEIGAALAAGRYGLVLAALVLAPGLFAVCALCLATAILVGQETYLFVAMLVVPAGFVATAVVIAVQALGRARRAG